MADYQINLEFANKDLLRDLDLVLSRIKDIRGEVKGMSKESVSFAKTGEEVASMRKEMDLLTERLDKAQKELSKFKSQTDQTNKTIGNTNKVTRFARGGFLQMVAAIGSAVGAYELARSAIRLFTNTIRAAVKTVADFDQGSANLASVLGKTKGEILALTNQARELGATTAFTAGEITKLQVELAKLGFDETEIQESTEAIQNLAIAAGGDLPRAAALAGSTIRSFGLDASEAGRVVDVIAKSFTTSALDISKFENSISQVAPVAATFGLTLEDTTALLAKLVDAGFNASRAGTSLRNILLNAADSSSKLGKAFGGTVNNFDDFIKGLNNLNESGIDLTETLELTDKRSVAAFNQFLQQTDAIEGLKIAYENAAGAADQLAKTQLDTLPGAITLLRSAWDGLVLSIEEGNGVIADFVLGVINGTTALINFLTPAVNINSELKVQGKTLAQNEAILNKAIPKYEELTKKLNSGKLSAEEYASTQNELNQYIEIIGNILPGAITQVDKYGRAIGLAADKVKLLRVEELKRVRALRESTLAEYRKEITKVEKEIESLQSQIETGIGITETLREGVSGKSTIIVDTFDLDADDIDEYREKIRELAAERKLLVNQFFDEGGDISPFDRDIIFAFNPNDIEEAGDEIKQKFTEAGDKTKNEIDALFKKFKNLYGKYEEDSEKALLSMVINPIEKAWSEYQITIRKLADQENSIERDLERLLTEGKIDQEQYDKYAERIDAFFLAFAQKATDSYDKALLKIREGYNKSLRDIDPLGINTDQNFGAQFQDPEDLRKKLIGDFEFEDGEGLFELLFGADDDNFFRELSSRFNLDEGEANEVKKQLEQSFNSIYSNVFEGINQSYQRQINEQQNLIDELRTQERRLTRELDIELRRRERGYANNAEAKEKELERILAAEEKAIKQRNELRKRQARLQLIQDAAIQGSNLVTAVTELVKNDAKVPIVGIFKAAASVAALFAIFNRAKAQSQAAINSLYTGGHLGLGEGYVMKGGQSDIPGRGTGYAVVDDSGRPMKRLGGNEWIVKETITRENAPFLNKLNKGHYRGIDIESALEPMIVNTAPHAKLKEDTGSIVNNMFLSNQGITKSEMRSLLSDHASRIIDHDTRKKTVHYSGNDKIITNGKRTIRIRG